MTMTSNLKVSATTNRRLWLSPDEYVELTRNASTSTTDKRTGRNTKDDGVSTHAQNKDSYDTIFDKFSSKPDPKSLSFYLSNTMVLVQEFVLTCFLLAGHRAARLEELDYIRRREVDNSSDGGIQSIHLLTSLGLIWITLLVAVIQNRFANSKRYTIRHRFTDFLLMAILLRFLSSVSARLFVAVLRYDFTNIPLPSFTCRYSRH